MPKKKADTIKDNIKRERHEMDLSGMVFGRAASQIALLLSGKRKVAYLPNVDCGDFVVAFNLSKLKVRGTTKLDKKIYYRHSGYPGSIKQVTFGEAREKNYPALFRRAVLRMLPKNKLRNEMIKRLEIKL